MDGNRSSALRTIFTSKLSQFLLASLFLSVVAVAALGGLQEAQGVIYGRVVNQRGQPQRVLVHLLAQGDVPAGDVFTDSNGSFAFRALPNGLYYVVVEAQGFYSARQAAILDLRIDPKVQITVSLEPLEKGPRATGQTISGSRSSYQLDVKDSGRSFNQRALREFEKGNEKQREGNLRAAKFHYEQALRADPDFYPALNNLGAILLRQKNHAKAEAAFLRSLQINPEEGDAYVNLGHVYFEEGRYQTAVERLEEGLKRSPHSPVGHFFLGSAYLKLGELAKAEPHLKEACVLDPTGLASAHLQLANLYLKRHDESSARHELQTYVDAQPSDPQAPAIRKLLADMAHGAMN